MVTETRSAYRVELLIETEAVALAPVRVVPENSVVARTMIVNPVSSTYRCVALNGLLAVKNETAPQWPCRELESVEWHAPSEQVVEFDSDAVCRYVPP